MSQKVTSAVLGSNLVTSTIKIRKDDIPKAIVILNQRKLKDFSELIHILIIEEESREKANFEKYGFYDVYDGVGRIADW